MILLAIFSFFSLGDWKIAQLPNKFALLPFIQNTARIAIFQFQLPCSTLESPHPPFPLPLSTSSLASLSSVVICQSSVLFKYQAFVIAALFHCTDGVVRALVSPFARTVGARSLASGSVSHMSLLLGK